MPQTLHFQAQRPLKIQRLDSTCRQRWHRRIATPLAFLLTFGVAGCDRGIHPAQIGIPAPDFIVRDDTQTVQLSAYRGKVVLLNFWATWCPPCLVELPSLIDLHHQMPQLVVLTVSTDEDASVYHQFLIDNHVDLLSVRDGHQMSNKRYGSYVFPESYLIDRNGVIRRKFIGAQDWTSPEIRTYIQSM